MLLVEHRKFASVHVLVTYQVVVWLLRLYPILVKIKCLSAHGESFFLIKGLMDQIY